MRCRCGTRGEFAARIGNELSFRCPACGRQWTAAAQCLRCYERRPGDLCKWCPKHLSPAPEGAEGQGFAPPLSKRRSDSA